MLRTLSGAATRFAIVIVGAGLGFIEVLRATAEDPEFSPRLRAAEDRLGEMMTTINGLTVRTMEAEEQLRARMTHEDFASAVERTVARLESEVDTRFDQQTRAIDALRTTVLQTDELLQRVLEGLERESDSDSAEGG